MKLYGKLQCSYKGKIYMNLHRHAMIPISRPRRRPFERFDGPPRPKRGRGDFGRERGNEGEHTFQEQC